MKTAHRKAAKHKREQREARDVPLIGFGLTFDIASGRAAIAKATGEKA